MMPLVVADLVAKMGLDDRAFNRGLDSQMSTFSRRTGAAGAAMTRGLTLPILAAGAASVKFSLDFEKSMTDVEALVGVSTKEVAGFKEEILKLAPAVGKSPKELGEAFYFIASAGLKGKAAMDALTASAKASAAGLGSTAIVADAVTSAINAYGESTLSATAATDVLLAAVREGKAEPEQFASSIGQVIPLASKMGVSFGEVSGIMAAMSLNGTDASMAVTQISAMLSSAIRPSEAGAKVLDSIGMSYAGLRDEIKNKGLSATITKLDTAFKGNIETLGKLFPNIRALRGVLALTGPEADKYAAIIDKVSNAQGDAAKAFDIAKGKPGFKMQQAWAEMQKALIKIGDVLVPAAANIAKAVGSIAGAFDKLGPAGTTAAVAFAGVLAAAGPVLTVMSKLSMLKMAKTMRGLGGLGDVLGAGGGGVLGGGTGTGKIPARVFTVGASGAASTTIRQGERTVATSLLAGGAGAAGAGGAAAVGGAALGTALGAALGGAIIAGLVGYLVVRPVAGVIGEWASDEESSATLKAMVDRGFKTPTGRGGGGNDTYFTDRAAAAAKVAATVRVAISNLGAEAATATGPAFERLREQITQTQSLADKGFEWGDFNAAKTDGQLRSMRDRIMGELHITIKQADRIMATMFKDWRPQDQVVVKINRAAVAVENRLAILRQRAGRNIHMGDLDATNMINEIARLAAAFGDVRSAARTAGNAAANAIRSPSGGGGSYRGHFMAAGGYVPARPGGTPVVLGEGGEGETVIPDSKMGRGTVVNINVANVHGTDRAAATKLANMAGEIFMQQVRFA